MKSTSVYQSVAGTLNRCSIEIFNFEQYVSERGQGSITLREIAHCSRRLALLENLGTLSLPKTRCSRLYSVWYMARDEVAAQSPSATRLAGWPAGIGN
jgi:hypothetical protein